MIWDPTATYESKTQPGVSFTLHRMGIGRRTSTELAVAEGRQRQRDLGREYRAAKAKYDELIAPSSVEKNSDGEPVVKTPAMVEHSVNMNMSNEAWAAIENGEILPAWIRAGLVSISGLDVPNERIDRTQVDVIDGDTLTHPMTAEELIAFGPRSLFTEIVEQIHADSYLSDSAAKNSPPASTLPVLEGGKTAGLTTVPDAKAQAST